MRAMESIVVAGASTHGLLIALAMRRAFPGVPVTLVLPDGAKPEDVAGEATSPAVIPFLCQALGISGEDLHRLARPVWSLGAKFLWGREKPFYLSFDGDYLKWPEGWPAELGYVAASEGMEASTPGLALMEAGKLFPRDGAHGIQPMEGICGLNLRAMEWNELLLKECRAVGVQFRDGLKREGVVWSGEEIAYLGLADGMRLTASLYVDASGGQRVLGRGDDGWQELGGGIFCTESVSRLRRRGSEPIRVHSTFEILDFGYRRRVDHDDGVGMGVVWNPRFAGEEEAVKRLEEKVTEGVMGRRTWKNGCVSRAWRGNRVSLGDAAGELDPLAGVRAGMLIYGLHLLRQVLLESGGWVGDEVRGVFNRGVEEGWREYADYLMVLYKVGGEGGLWAAARERSEWHLMGELLGMWGSVGPSLHLESCLPNWPGAVGIEGWVRLLLAAGVPFPARELPGVEWRGWWRSMVEKNRHLARQAVPAEMCLAAARRQAAGGGVRSGVR